MVNLFQPSKRKGDWFDALIVAADMYKEELERVNILSKKIILMTNFQAPSHINEDQVELVRLLTVTSLSCSYTHKEIDLKIKIGIFRFY